MNNCARREFEEPKAYARDQFGNWFEIFQVSDTCYPGHWWVEGLFGGKFLTKELWGVE